MAAPPPPPPPPLAPKSLDRLPQDTRRLILDRIPCSVDRSRMSLVCHAWRRMVRRQLHRPSPLPWLLLRAPFTVGGLFPSTRVACVLSGCRAHHYLNIVPPDARCFGSHKDAWLFLSAPPLDQPSAHIALNIRTGVVREFPRYLVRSADPERTPNRMVIHAAALSHSPDDERCSGAAIVTSWTDPAPDAVAAVPPRRRCVVLWREDWPRACHFETVDDAAFDDEDVIFMSFLGNSGNGTFIFLTQGEHLRQCTPPLSDSQIPQWRRFYYRPRGGLCDQHVSARYLVVPTSGELLMVVRFTPHPNQPTSMFKVFRSTQRNKQDADAADFPVAKYRTAWSELDTLGDRILFVGHGCSRCYKASEYPGFKSGIYFLDDGKFYDDAVIFGNGNARRYPCSDNGKWSEGHVERCFPRPDPSDHSAPVWLLP